MFYLGGSNFPKTPEQLAAAITDGLCSLLALPTGREVVTIEPAASPRNNGYPAFTRVALDLTGARLIVEELPPEPKGAGKTQPAGIASKLEISGHPLYVRDAAVDLSLSASDARVDYDRDVSGKPMLLLADAKNGSVTLQIRKKDLDALALSAAKEAAGKLGVQIVETQLVLTQAGERSVAADVRVKAKKLFLTATLHLRGKLSVDDALCAKISELSVTGEGALGEMASVGIRPQLQQVNGREFPLTALPLGEVRLHDLRMQVGDPLKVTAVFGS